MTIVTIDLTPAARAFHDTYGVALEDVESRLMAGARGESEAVERLGLELGDEAMTHRIDGWNALDSTAQHQIRSALISAMGRRLAADLPF